jgi:hypothetical protein
MPDNATANDHDELMPVRAAARRLNVSPATMHKRVAKGLLPAVPGKHGKLVRLSDVLPLAEMLHRPPNKPTVASRLDEQAAALDRLEHAFDDLSSRLNALEERIEDLHVGVAPRKR